MALFPACQAAAPIIGTARSNSPMSMSCRKWSTLIQAQPCLYEFSTKAVQAADQMLSDSTNLIR